MTTEQYVSFGTAKMLQEAGFDVPCNGTYFCSRQGESKLCIYDIKSELMDLSYDERDGFQYEYLAPTQALAARWLREEHRIVVDVSFIPPSTDGDDWRYFIGNMGDMVWIGDYVSSDEYYGTYEQALEAGLQEAIKLIKK